MPTNTRRPVGQNANVRVGRSAAPHSNRSGHCIGGARSVFGDPCMADAASVLAEMEAQDASPQLSDEQVAEVKRRFGDPNPKFLTLEEVRERSFSDLCCVKSSGAFLHGALRRL
jgi:hypothetical protein